jgi:argininosuccinate synthase
MLVDVALNENADAVAHGCTGKGNDQVRFEVGVQALAPKLKVIAPLREWEFKSREDEMEYALNKNIPVKATKSSPYSIDENIWGISVECGVLEDPQASPPEDAYQITINPQYAPDEPAEISIQFERGIPVGLNDQLLPPVELVNRLRDIGAEHGIGRLDLIENRVVGIKSREIYEAPAAVILHFAHNELEKMVLDKETFRYKQDVSNKIANIIYDGLWYSPLFNALNSFVDETQKNMTGEIKVELFKGNIRVLSRNSQFSLYNKNLATYTNEDTFNHKASEGFINIYGLPYKTIASLSKKEIKEEVTV